MDRQEPSSSWRLSRPTVADAVIVASWSRSAQEAAAWASRAEYPVRTETILGWWDEDDVSPWLLLDPDDVPAAYGEVWDDAEEDEVELARLIVDPTRRRMGVGRRLVADLVAVAHGIGRAECFLRVVPGNDAALGLYRSSGFRDVEPDLTQEWNRGQPVAYHWLQYSR